MTATTDLSHELQLRYDRLRQIVSELESVAVAFSGGVDSTFLLRVCHDQLGQQAVAVTTRSRSFPAREVAAAADYCRQAGIRHIVSEFEELAIVGFADNPTNRCYLCKTNLLSHVRRIARREGLAQVAEGSNLDDNGDYRPGLTAVAEQGVRSPLREAGLTKADIRQLSRRLGLPTWDKPSFACLASRIPYGDTITAQRLEMIDQAEQFLFDLGLKQVRVRLHGRLARIETDAEGFERLTGDKAVRPQVYQALRRLGFTYVTLDLLGYRSGSLNETLGTDSTIE
ncbi:MAG: ATP-dependent sacrificial sulfur transferase LarE [Propionibacteriaceae bacterium]|nr:ATP-dependent sacrificial sulfur transferase LarE [Propionibacteriaceae bacterium]